MGKKKDNSKQIKASQLQAQDIMNDTTVPVDDRIRRTADIYRQAEALAEDGSLEENTYESLLTDTAKFFLEYGMYKESLPRYTHLVTLRESIYGLNHSVTATAYHDIGEVYRNLCDYPKALEYIKRSLDIREKVLGQKHLETAESYNDTGIIYIFQGCYDKALELILKAKTIREEVVGENHPDTAESYVSLGFLGLKCEDGATGLENYSKALKIYESTLGSEHRKTAIAYYGVGYSYYQMGNYSDALDYCTKALSIYEKEFGKKHPETAVVYGGIGYIHENIGGVSKALDYVTKAQEINEEMLGDEHLNTAASFSALGWVKLKMQDDKEALECFEKSLNIIEKIFGLEHPDTAEAYNNMGLMYYLTDENIKAYEYFVNAHQFYAKCLKSEYIDRKIQEVESNMRLVEVNDEEEVKGTRDLFLETLTKIGCQYEIDPEDEYISFGYQGENFVASATNEERFVRVWDTFWGHVELYDADEFSRLKKAVNHANLNCSTMTVYSINEELKKVDVHCKSVFPLMPQMPDLDDYLRTELNDFFTAHHLVGTEMAKLRDQESNEQAN